MTRSQIAVESCFTLPLSVLLEKYTLLGFNPKIDGAVYEMGLDSASDNIFWKDLISFPAPTMLGGDLCPLEGEDQQQKIHQSIVSKLSL